MFGNATNNGTIDNYCTFIVDGTYTENGTRSDHDPAFVSTGSGSNGSGSGTTSGAPACSVIWKDASGAIVGYNNLVTGLSAGTYTAEITCDNGCTSTETVTLSAPVSTPIAISLVGSTNSDVNNCNGSASVSVTGGVSPYTYEWIGTTQTGATATGLCQGTYVVRVTDANGCFKDETITIGLNGGVCDFTVTPTA